MAQSSFDYARSTLIAAPAEAIIAEIADLRRHEAWSPFAKPDPKAKTSYTGAPGAGQTHTFEGGKGGAGRLQIDAVEPGRVLMTLTMLKPMKAVNTVEFTVRPEGDAQRVTWRMFGPQTLMGRIMDLFINCDAMCGRMFEQGLAALKAKLEGEPERLAA